MNTPILSYDADKERLKLTFPEWDQDSVAAIQQMLLCWYRRGTSLYSFPVALAKIEAMEILKEITIDPSVKEFDMEQSTLQWTGTDGIEDSTLFPDQVIPTNLLYKRDKAIVTAAPGTGKTIMSAVALRERYHKLAVVVAPLSSLASWEHELKIWYTDPLLGRDIDVEVITWRKLPDSFYFSSIYDQRVILISPQVMHALVEQGRVDELLGDNRPYDQILILDESYLYKNRKADRQDDASSLASNFRTVWLLSGMPVSRFNDDLFAQLHILFPSVFRSYWKFASRYCLLKDTVWGIDVVNDLPYAARRIKGDFNDILIECSFPETVPDWLPVEIPCQMTDRQEKIYENLRDKLIVDAGTLGALKPLALKTILSLSGRLLQVASNPLLVEGVDSSGKWERLLELVPRNELPALIWINYIKTGEVLLERLKALGYRVSLLAGNCKPKDRKTMVDSFQAGELDLLIIHPAVGKYSHTLTAAKTAYYLERNFDREAYYQSLFRVRRIISKHACKIVYLLSTYQTGKQTIDHVVHRLLLESSRKAQKLTVGKLIGSI